MKKNLIKALLSLGVLTLVGISGMTDVQGDYLVNIGNMDSYGVLNLGKLTMRSTGGTEGIILDGAYSAGEYIIKIGENSTNDNLSLLRVSNICDKNGNNCKRVADLNTGIAILGGNGNVCFKQDEKTINCNQTLGAGVITINQGSKQWTFNVNTTSPQTINLSGDIAIEGTNTRLCTKKNNNTIECNVTTGAVLNVSVPNPVPTLNRGNTTTIGSVGGTEFKVTMPANPHVVGRNVVTNTTNGTSSSSTNNNNTYLNYVENNNEKSHIQIKGSGGINVSANSSNVITIESTSQAPGNGKVTIYQGNTNKGSFNLNQANNSDIYLDTGGNGKVTIYQGNTNKGSFNLNQANDSDIYLDAGGEGGIDFLTGEYNKYCKYMETTKGGVTETGINCTFDIEQGTSIWEIGNVTKHSTTIFNAIKPKSTYISKDLYLPEGDIYHDGNVLIKTLGSNSVYRTNDIRITDYGVSIGEMANRTAGLGVHGPITIGKYAQEEGHGGTCPPTVQRNTISIYASGSAGSDNFEIVGNPRVLIGAKNAGYMYFESLGDGGDIGINNSSPKAKLDVNGSIRVGYCSPNSSCGSNNVGEIRYYESSNVGYFVGCRKSSNGYEWIVLSNGTETKTNVSYYCSATPSVPYNEAMYSTQLAQPQPDCN